MAMGLPRIGRYETQELLGVGGFASAYKAFDPRLEDTVAIKVLAENWSHVPDVRKRFRSEAVMLRRLQTEYEISGFVDVFDVDETSTGQPFFVMSFANRGTLADRAGAKPWTLNELLPFIKNISTSLFLLHELGFIHRDLKPSNIFFRSMGPEVASEPTLLQADERVLISDLGMAKDLNRDTGSGMSLAGGTPRFMAPEQHQIGADVDHRVDIYAASVLVDLLVVDPSEPLCQVLEAGQAEKPDERPPTIKAWYEAIASTVNKPTRPPPMVQAEMTKESGRTAALESNSTAQRGPMVENGSMAGSVQLPQPGGDGQRSFKSRNVRGLAIGATMILILLIGASVLILSLRSGSRVLGPDTIEVGQTVSYRADVDSDASISWTDWNGETIKDDGLVVTPRLPGELTFFLTANGKTTKHSVMVVASSQSPIIEGPSQAKTGETVVFSIGPSSDVASHYWLDSEGKRVAVDQLSFTPAKPGDYTVILIAVDDLGVERGSRHRVEVVDG